MLLRNIKFWDGVSEDYGIEFDAIRITAAGTIALTSADDRSSGEPELDLAGAFVLPGLIDAHIHLCLDPDESDPFAHGKVPAKDQLSAMGLRAKKWSRPGSRRLAT